MSTDRCMVVRLVGVRSAAVGFGPLLAALVAGVLAAGLALAQTASSDESAWVLLPEDLVPQPTDPLLRRGHAVYINRCAACHEAIPGEVVGPLFLPAMPGTQALQERYRDALPAELHRRTDLQPAYIEFVVRRGLGSMPFFRPTEVSHEDLQALIAYLTRPREDATE